MGEYLQYLSDVIPGFLDIIHKLLIYDPVIVFFIVGNVTYHLFEWGNSFKNTRRKTAPPCGKDMNCRAFKNKDSSVVNYHKNIETMGYDTDSFIRKVSSPIGNRKNCKRLASSVMFKRSKISSKKETDLPIATILHLGMKIIQAASPEVCIYKSPEQMRNNYKRQNPFLQPGVMEGVTVARSELQTAETKNKTEMIEKHENNGTTNAESQMPQQVTVHVYSNPLQNPHVFSYSSVNDQDIPSTTVAVVTHRCADGHNSTRLLHHTDPSKVSTSKLDEVFKSFKAFLVENMKPICPQRRRRTGRASGNKDCPR